MSDTVAVHDEAWFTITGLEQITVVEVARRFTVMLAVPLVLPEWDESPPYVPVTSALPLAVGVNATEQLLDDRVQIVAVNEPTGPVSANVTVPVGVVTVPGEVSLTVAVHVVAWPVVTAEGEHIAALFGNSVHQVLVVRVPRFNDVCDASSPFVTHNRMQFDSIFLLRHLIGHETH